MNLAQRIISFPFVIGMYAIIMNFMVVKGAYLFLRYGGEFLIYMKDDRANIDKIYDVLKKDIK